MRELTLNGDVCSVLKKIQDLADATPTGSNILYPIENWDPHSIKAAEEKRILETLDAMEHVIRLKGHERKDKALVFSLTQTKSFGGYYQLNCNPDQTKKSPIQDPSPKIKIHINEIKGIYRDDDPQLRYEIRGQRKKYVLNLLHGHPIESGLKESRASKITNAVDDINRLYKLFLKVDFDLIEHSNSSSYYLNETSYFYIEDELPTVTVTQR